MSFVINSSRRENAPYNVGRYAITRARRVRLATAAANAASCRASPPGESKPSVSIDDPDSSNAREMVGPLTVEPIRDQNSVANSSQISTPQIVS